MIRDIREYEVAVWLRQEILVFIDSVKDANQFFWDDRTTNAATQRKLNELKCEFARRLAQLGVVFIREHGPCGSAKHGRFALHSVVHFSSRNYWRLEFLDGRGDAYFVENEVLFVDGVRMVHKESKMELLIQPCPCRPHKPVEHSIASYEAWPDNAGTRMEVLVECHHVLERAHRLAEFKKARSAIREQLLLCLIQINEAIAPISAEEHIAGKTQSTPQTAQ